MDGKEIREAFERVLEDVQNMARDGLICDVMDDIIYVNARKALAALSTIDLECVQAKRELENSKDIIRRLKDEITSRDRCLAIDSEAIKRYRKAIQNTSLMLERYAALHESDAEPIDKIIKALDDSIIGAEPAQVECPDCIGRGWQVERDRHEMPVQVQCESCAGRGYIGVEPAQDNKGERDGS